MWTNGDEGGDENEDEVKGTVDMEKDDETRRGKTKEAREMMLEVG